jgi:hypothetical protein
MARLRRALLCLALVAGALACAAAAAPAAAGGSSTRNVYLVRHAEALKNTHRRGAAARGAPAPLAPGGAAPHRHRSIADDARWRAHAAARARTPPGWTS